MTQDEQIEEALRLYHESETMMANAASKVSRLEIIVLVLSVVTTGSIWLVITQALTQLALWLGAFASTAITGITLYLNISGAKQVRRRTISIHQELGQFIAECRASNGALPLEEYWKKLKTFENSVTRLRHRQFGDND